MEVRFDVVDHDSKGWTTSSRQFTWVVGIQITTLIAIVGALLARP